jgi:hypothetical protein
MKNLFDAATAEEVKSRLAQLRAESERLWGKMSPAQAMAHCSVGMEVSLGDRLMRQVWLGKLLGKRVKASLLSGKPIGRNLPTDKAYADAEGVGRIELSASGPSFAAVWGLAYFRCFSDKCFVRSP